MLAHHQMAMTATDAAALSAALLAAKAVDMSASPLRRYINRYCQLERGGWSCSLCGGYNEHLSLQEAKCAEPPVLPLADCNRMWHLTVDVHRCKFIHRTWNFTP